MAISSNLSQKNYDSLIESSVTSGQTARAVCNPDGTNIGGSSSSEGPGAPTVDSYSSISISAVTGSNQSLIAAPGASKQIWVYGYSFTCDTDATTVAFQDEDDTALVTYGEGFKQYGGVAVNPTGNFSMPVFKVATNKALEADVATGSIGGTLQYAVISV